MATLLEAPPATLPESPRAACRGRAMTRCECAEMPFEEIARRLREDGASFAELSRRTGCGQTCTACVPDLEAFLARRRG